MGRWSEKLFVGGWITLGLAALNVLLGVLLQPILSKNCQANSPPGWCTYGLTLGSLFVLCLLATIWHQIGFRAIRVGPYRNRWKRSLEHYLRCELRDAKLNDVTGIRFSVMEPRYRCRLLPKNRRKLVFVFDMLYEPGINAQDLGIEVRRDEGVCGTAFHSGQCCYARAQAEPPGAEPRHLTLGELPWHHDKESRLVTGVLCIPVFSYDGEEKRPRTIAVLNVDTTNDTACTRVEDAFKLTPNIRRGGESLPGDVDVKELIVESLGDSPFVRRLSSVANLAYFHG